MMREKRTHQISGRDHAAKIFPVKTVFSDFVYTTSLYIADLIRKCSCISLRSFYTFCFLVSQ